MTQRKSHKKMILKSKSFRLLRWLKMFLIQQYSGKIKKRIKSAEDLKF